MSSARSPARARSPQPSGRDLAVVELAAKFRQVNARQIGEVLFADVASKTPLDRTLKRLYERGYLDRLQVRPAGGAGGGSAQYVYQLGRQGWRLLGLPGRYWAHRSVNEHAIELSGLYAEIVALTRTAAVELLQFLREQEAWREVAGVQLTPDAYIELGYQSTRTMVMYFIELDRGTESVNVLQDKCSRYWKAYQHWKDEVFPRVLFVVPDPVREKCLDRVVAGGPSEAQPLFRSISRRQVRDFLLGCSGDSAAG